VEEAQFYTGKLDKFKENTFDLIMAPCVFKYIDLKTAETVTKKKI
jgi:hypothetical protein